MFFGRLHLAIISAAKSLSNMVIAAICANHGSKWCQRQTGKSAEHVGNVIRSVTVSQVCLARQKCLNMRYNHTYLL